MSNVTNTLDQPPGEIQPSTETELDSGKKHTMERDNKLCGDSMQCLVDEVVSAYTCQCDQQFVPKTDGFCGKKIYIFAVILILTSVKDS